MRKIELIDFLRNHNSILDESVPNINSPILKPAASPSQPAASLQPTEYKPLPAKQKRRDEMRELEEMLGLRPSRLRKIPEIKVTSPEEFERETKIKKKSRRLIDQVAA